MVSAISAGVARSRAVSQRQVTYRPNATITSGRMVAFAPAQPKKSNPTIIQWRQSLLTLVGWHVS